LLQAARPPIRPAKTRPPTVEGKTFFACRSSKNEKPTLPFDVGGLCRRRPLLGQAMYLLALDY
jgi:hypothetical protein